MTKTKTFDCVEMKRQAQKTILDRLEGRPPEEQYEIIRKLAEDLPLWKELREAKAANEANGRRTG